MSSIKVYPMSHSSVLRIYSEKELILVDPEYQRMGEIWTLEKRQLLIDSILNDFDIPKLYMHEFSKLRKLKGGINIKYAIIDGRQRLETIWSFIENDFSLDKDFKYYSDQSIKLGDLTYDDLAKKYPMIKTFFDSYTLPIVLVNTDDIDMIEEMFSRLNEAVPLNAAEKRNAFGGVMAKTIRDVSSTKFFKEKVLFKNKRYQHREVAAKLLFLIYTTRRQDKIIDTKKAYLDDFVKKFKKRNMDRRAERLKNEVNKVLVKINRIFTKHDSLLNTQSMPIIYFMVFKEAIEEGWWQYIGRRYLLKFDKERKKNRAIAEKNISKASYELLEFDRMAQQGTNDGVSIRYRTDILKKFLKKYK